MLLYVRQSSSTFRMPMMRMRRNSMTAQQVIFYYACLVFVNLYHGRFHASLIYRNLTTSTIAHLLVALHPCL
jgi:hypothetical protein